MYLEKYVKKYNSIQSLPMNTLFKKIDETAANSGIVLLKMFIDRTVKEVMELNAFNNHVNIAVNMHNHIQRRRTRINQYVFPDSTYLSIY